MPIDPLVQQSWLFLPPLGMPLSLRLRNGRFGELRPRPLDEETGCTATQVIPAGHPDNPTGEDLTVAFGIHQAVDLDAAAGDCVYAAYGGRVIEVEVRPGGTAGNLSIDHHPRGLGFVTSYNHVAEIGVVVGQRVGEGQPIAAVSAAPDEPHLHFELWAVLDRREPDGPLGDSDKVPIDPTRALYEWERRLVPDEPLPGVQSAETIGVTLIEAVPFFVVALAAGGELHVPMYEPMARDERAIVAVLSAAHQRAAGLELFVRESAFWGVDVVTRARLAGGGRTVGD